MIPLGDDDSPRKIVPIVTYILIVINILVFLLELQGGESFIMNWSFVPARFLADPLANLPTIFTSMFMHAGTAHLAGNMVYLWIFGDNVEDSYGTVKYLLFYLVCGIGATFSQMMVNSDSTIPNLGASGAIAGVLGAYILLFPSSKVRVLVGQSITQMPALLVIGFWFVLQFFSSISSLYSTSEEGGVAYLAHVGGFVAGVALTLIHKAVRQPP